MLLILVSGAGWSTKNFCGEQVGRVPWLLPRTLPVEGQVLVGDPGSQHGVLQASCLLCEVHSGPGRRTGPAPPRGPSRPPWPGALRPGPAEVRLIRGPSLPVSTEPHKQV